MTSMARYDTISIGSMWAKCEMLYINGITFYIECGNFMNQISIVLKYWYLLLIMIEEFRISLGVL